MKNCNIKQVENTAKKHSHTFDTYNEDALKNQPWPKGGKLIKSEFAPKINR